MARRFIFVGEKPSHTAHRKTWTWESGRLCAKPLFEALRAIDIEPTACGFINLYGDTPSATVSHTSAHARCRVHVLLAARKAGITIVAMGNKVALTLAGYEVPHIKLRHPAARGAGRKRERYHEHVREALR